MIGPIKKRIREINFQGHAKLRGIFFSSFHSLVGTFKISVLSFCGKLTSMSTTTCKEQRPVITAVVCKTPPDVLHFTCAQDKEADVKQTTEKRGSYLQNQVAKKTLLKVMVDWCLACLPMPTRTSAVRHARNIKKKKKKKGNPNRRGKRKEMKRRKAQL